MEPTVKWSMERGSGTITRMPNGNPHDHPYSDVVAHGMRVFSVELDTVIAEIGSLVHLLDMEGAVSDELSWRMLQADPRFGPTSEDPEALRAPLTAVRDDLVAEARRRRIDPTPALLRARQATVKTWSGAESR